MKSQFAAFHPAILFCYYTGSVALMMLFLHPVYLFISVSLIIIMHVYNDYGKNLLGWLKLIIPTGLLIFLMNPLFNERGRVVLFEIYGHRVTKEATIYGGISALSLIGVMLIFVSYNEVMTPNKLLFLFSKILPRFAVLLMLTLRFIPLMRRRLEEITAIQTSKGNSILEGTWTERMKNGMLYVQVLLTFSLEEAIQTADSMKARGYGSHNRTTYEFFRLKKIDFGSLFYLLVLFLVCVYGRVLGFGFLTIYPTMERLSISSLEGLDLVAFMFFISFPLLIEIGGRAKWRLLK